jgi:hypothetical protein
VINILVVGYPRRGKGHPPSATELAGPNPIKLRFDPSIGNAAGSTLESLQKGFGGEIEDVGGARQGEPALRHLSGHEELYTDLTAHPPLNRHGSGDAS